MPSSSMMLPVASKIDFDFHGPCGSNASNQHHVTHKSSSFIVKCPRASVAPKRPEALSTCTSNDAR